MREGDFLVERYRLVRTLGKGAMGQVWLAHDTLLNRRVAIKHLIMGMSESAKDGFVQRAMREARLAASLNHANAVQIYDLIIDRDIPHVVMEYVEGETLESRIEKAGRMSPSAIRPVIRQVAAGLAAAHDLGIVHRDVKPANILIAAATGEAKLVDFGIARASHDANLTATGLVVGTLSYMGPEVAAGDPATSASDVWALGATAYVAAEGQVPFPGDSAAHMLYRKVSEPPPSPSHAGDLSDLIVAMMATEPAHRPRVREVVQALEGSGPPRWGGPAPHPDAETRTVRRVAPQFETTIVRAAPLAPSPTAPTSHEDGRFESGTRTFGPRSRRSGFVVAGVLIALVIAGGTVALVLTSQPSAKAGAGGSHSSSPAQTSSTVSSPPASTTSPPKRNSSSSSSATLLGDVMRYTGLRGLSAIAPSSWNNVCPGHSDAYYWCADGSGFDGGYFRLRLVSTTQSFEHSVSGELDYFHTRVNDGSVQRSDVAGWKVSGNAVPAADLSFTFLNGKGAPRQGIERVFAIDGASGTTTYVIETVDIPTRWSRTQQVFHELIDTAEVRS